MLYLEFEYFFNRYGHTLYMYMFNSVITYMYVLECPKNRTVSGDTLQCWALILTYLALCHSYLLGMLSVLLLQPRSRIKHSSKRCQLVENSQYTDQLFVYTEAVPGFVLIVLYDYHFL